MRRAYEYILSTLVTHAFIIIDQVQVLHDFYIQTRLPAMTSRRSLGIMTG